jgi:hypothetical protein
VLAHLFSGTLVELTQAFGFGGMTVLKKSDIASFLYNNGSITVEAILRHLEQLCIDFSMDREAAIPAMSTYPYLRDGYGKQIF